MGKIQKDFSGSGEKRLIACRITVGYWGGQLAVKGIQKGGVGSTGYDLRQAKKVDCVLH